MICNKAFQWQCGQGLHVAHGPQDACLCCAVSMSPLPPSTTMMWQFSPHCMDSVPPQPPDVVTTQMASSPVPPTVLAAPEIPAALIGAEVAEWTTQLETLDLQDKPRDFV